MRGWSSFFYGCALGAFLNAALHADNRFQFWVVAGLGLLVLAEILWKSSGDRA